METHVLFFYENYQPNLYKENISLKAQYLLFSQSTFTQFSKIEIPPPKHFS